MLSWVDGQPHASLPLADRGLAYGDGLFETLQVRDGQPRLLERHLQRLGEGCARLRLNCDMAQLRHELIVFCGVLGEGVTKMLVTRGDGVRGYAAPAQAARRILLSSPLLEYPAQHALQGVQLFPCQTRLAEQPLLAGLKHLNRLEQVLARAEWQDPQYAEGLVLDRAGRVIEGVFSNLFLVHDGVLGTPSVERCGVAGVMRAELLANAERMGVAWQVRDYSLDELYQADEIFLCNSLYGVWPVCRLEQRDWPVGPLTRKLQAIASGLVDG